MKRFCIFTLLISVILTSCADSYIVNTIENGVEIAFPDRNSGTRVVFYSDGTVRCTKWIGGSDSCRSLVVLHKPDKVEFEKTETNDSVFISTPKITVSVSKHSGNVSYNRANGKRFLSELYDDLSFVTYKGDKGYAVVQKFLTFGNEGIYGFGQNQDHIMNYRFNRVTLSQSNTNAINPVMVASSGYGIFWDNYSFTEFESNDNKICFQSKMGDNIDYYVFAGNDADGVVAQYRNLTGKAVMLPKWAFGYWQSKERYQSQDELLSVAKRYRKQNIPLDCMVQDWEWWKPGKWSCMEFDRSRFADPKKMMDDLHNMNLHAIISIWPCVAMDTKMHDEMYAKGLLYEPIGWGNFRYIDFYNPEACEVYNKYVYNNIYPCGFDGWWHDSTEPDVTNSLTKEAHQYETERLDNNYLGSFTRYLNPYVLAVVDNAYNKWTSTETARRACILTRSAFAGIQRDGAIVWSGDIGASWEIYRQQITAGLNFCISGIPYWSFDIGGFLIGSYDGLFTYGAKDPAYMELYTRMFQYGAFTPVFRSHGSDAPREMWEMGKFEPVLINYDKLRYRLLPYIYSLAGHTYKDGYTLMRPLVMDFVNDRQVYDIKDEYMFGNEILVAPVTDFMYHTPPQISHIVPEDVFVTNSGKKGIDVKYFNDPDFQNLTKQEIASNVDVYWYTGRPDYVTDSVYSIRWEGKIIAPETGKYQFQVKSFDSRVIIFNGDTLKVQLDCNEPYFEFLNLEAGKEYPIICETQNRQTGAARFRLYWKTPSDFAKEQQTADKPKTRSVYLPEGANWVDFFDGKVYNGGQTVTIDAPIEKMPLLIRQGSVLPMGPVVQYADEQPFAPLEIRIYPGADGRFVLYEDEGDNLNYQQGNFSEIEFVYDNAAHTLTISDRKGSFEGMSETREFHIVMVDDKNGLGINESKNYNVVKYEGKKITIDNL